MKNSKVLSFLLLLLFFVDCSATDISKRERIIEYFRVNGVMQSIEQNAVLGVEEMKRSNPKLPVEFWNSDSFKSAIQWWKEAYLDAYVEVAIKNISDAELDELIAFHKTDLGKRFLALNIRIQPHYNKVSAKLFGEFSDKFKGLVREYSKP